MRWREVRSERMTSGKWRWSYGRTFTATWLSFVPDASRCRRKNFDRSVSALSNGSLMDSKHESQNYSRQRGNLGVIGNVFLWHRDAAVVVVDVAGGAFPSAPRSARVRLICFWSCGAGLVCRHAKHVALSPAYSGFAEQSTRGSAGHAHGC